MLMEAMPPSVSTRNNGERAIAVMCYSKTVDLSVLSTDEGGHGLTADDNYFGNRDGNVGNTQIPNAHRDKHLRKINFGLGIRHQVELGRVPKIN